MPDCPRPSTRRREALRPALALLVCAPFFALASAAATRTVAVEVGFIEPVAASAGTPEAAGDLGEAMDGAQVIALDAQGIVTDARSSEAALHVVVQAPKRQPMTLLVDDRSGADDSEAEGSAGQREPQPFLRVTVSFL